MDGPEMTELTSEFAKTVDAARRETNNYGTDPDFRKEWLGLNRRSAEVLSNQTWLFGWLIGSVTESLAGWRILDIGCGDGRWLRRFLDYDAEPQDVIGIDISNARFEIGQRKNPLVRMIQTDGISFPFADASFDLITQFVTFSMIGTFALRKHTAEEMCRVLKPGGYIFWWDWLTLDPAHYFNQRIIRQSARISQPKEPSDRSSPFRGIRFVKHSLDMAVSWLFWKPTHAAALIGPKGDTLIHAGPRQTENSE